MNSSKPFSARGFGLLAVVVGAVFHSAAVMAGGSSARLTMGDVTQGGGNVSTSSNPASGAFDRRFLDDDTNVAGYWSLGAGVEYGNVDDLFDRIDEASAALEGQGSSNGGAGDSSEGGGSGTHVGTINDIDNPDLDALIASVKQSAAVVAGILAFIQTEGYAIAKGGTDLALLINGDALGGTLRFDASGWVSTSAVGLTEAINFDADAALAALTSAYNLGPNDPETTYDLTGGLNLRINPATGHVKATYENDSLLLTRAAKVTEFGLSYSRTLIDGSSGALFLGLRPKVTQIGLTRITTRLGDLTDAEDAFDDIRDADFITQDKVGADIGLLWQAKRYRAGISLINLTEPEFDFPELDYSGISNVDIRNELGRTEVYTAERQVKLEAAWLSEQQHWGIFTAYDANSVFDPAGLETQWGSLSTAYSFDNIWFNNLRVGVSRNFAGNELSYLSAGFTMFRFLKLDVASTLSETHIDGEKLPRGASIALGFNYSF